MRSAQEFKKLLAASFISQSGSHFLTIALAAFVLVSSGSPTQSALVFVLSFLPSILVSSKLGNWIDHSISKWLIARNEAISIGTSALCGVCIYFKLPLAILCLVLAARSVLIFVTRAAASKWIKLITPPELQTRRIQLFFLSFFLSTALAGILAGVVLSIGTIWTVVTVDILTYLAGIGFIIALKNLPEQPVAQPTSAADSPQMIETLKHIFLMPKVRWLFLVVCFSQTVFQGAYSALVSLLPIQHFQLGVGGIGFFQLAASVGIIGGFLVNWLYPNTFREQDGSFPKKTLIAAALGTLCIFTSIQVPTAFLSALAFFGFNFAYECIWLHNNSEFFRASPKASAARYQFTIAACAAFLMSISTLAYSLLTEYFGLTTGVVSTSVGFTITFAFVASSTREEQVTPIPERAAP